jgi:hypothetical protein
MNILSLKWLAFFMMFFCCEPIAILAADRVAIHDAGSGWGVQVCQAPKIVCRRIMEDLAQGSFLDFRSRPNGEHAQLRLLSPFAVERIEPLDKARCLAKRCPAQMALGGLQEELLKQGYYTQSAVVFPGGAVITLRTERINSAMKVFKGGCRFDLNPKCSDSDNWLQDDQKSGEKCGFSLTRLFLATPTLPTFVESADFASTTPTQPLRGSAEVLGSVSFDTTTVKIYELLYVHKVCPSAMTIIRNGT